MSDWTFAQTQPSDELAQLHFFSVKKTQPDGDIEFVITVKEYVDRNKYHMRFFAEADLSECMQAIHRFPYEGEDVLKAKQ